MGAIFGSLILIAVLIGGLVRPDTVPERSFGQSILDGLLIAYTVFVVATPNSCSTAIYMGLAYAVNQIMHHNVLVRKISTIEYLAYMTDLLVNISDI